MSSKEQTFSTSSCSSSSGYTGYCTSCNKCSTCTTTTTTSSSSDTYSHHSTSFSYSLTDISSATQQAEIVKAQIYDDEFLKVQQSLLQPGIENSEKRFKVHQFTRSAMMLPDFKDFDRLRPLIDGLIDELDARDLLGCATALELLANIAAARNENIRYFDQIGLMDKVYDLFKFTKENPDFGVIHIACIRFFGYLSTAEPNSLAMFPLFASDVFNAVYCFDAIDPVRRMLAFDTLAIVSSTSGAKQFLSWKECPYNMNKAMNHLGVAIATGMPELKARYLNAVKTIFESFNPDCALESPVILHGWFRELGEPFPQLLLQCLKMPFPEVQIASLQAMLALMCHQWAPAYFSTLNGFLDFLTDRERHFPALGHQLKYDLVCRFIEFEPAQFDPQSMQRLHNYRVSGPYAPPKKVDIETEESG